MRNDKINIDPDWLLEWLLDCGYVEKTESAFNPYKISTDPDTDRPYTVTSIVKKLRMFKRNVARSNHSRPFCRELKKCFDEHHITYLSLLDHAQLCTELKPNRLKELEEKLGVNLDPLSKVERKKVSILYSRQTKAVGKEQAMKRMYLYIQRRLKNPGVDLRKGKVEKYGHIEDIPKPEQTSTFQPEDMSQVLQSHRAMLSPRATLSSKPFSNCNSDDYSYNCQSYDEALNEYR